MSDILVQQNTLLSLIIKKNYLKIKLKLFRPIAKNRNWWIKKLLFKKIDHFMKIFFIKSPIFSGSVKIGKNLENSKSGKQLKIRRPSKSDNQELLPTRPSTGRTSSSNVC